MMAMTGKGVLEFPALKALGEDIYALAAELFPICRSITGDGVRETLRILSREVDLQIHEIPTGTQVFDWTVPREWNIRGATIKDSGGATIVDFKSNNLHVVSYSAPIRRRMTLSELRPHLHTLPAQPDLIAYRTSYYHETWGFCLSHRQLLSLADDELYDVEIDSTLADGSLTYGECLIRGERADEILLSAHVCHPSLANDNCSGMALLAKLANHLSARRNTFSYRVVFAPGTIGAIAWLAENEAHIARIKAGLVISGVGDAGAPTYKRTRHGGASIDHAMAHVLSHASAASPLRDFSPYGYDERQYGSPGIDLPVGLFQRSAFGEFPQYHTSADNMAFISPGALEDSFDIIAGAIEILETDAIFLNTNPNCEPQLGKRGLYGPTGGNPKSARENLAMLWILNLSDGKHSLLDIADRSKTPFSMIRETARRLFASDLLRPLRPPN